MKRIFVVSPLRGGGGRAQVENEIVAERLCLAVIGDGHAPFAPHLLYTRFLNDARPDDRVAGISAGLAWLRAADEVWVFTGHGVSAGMTAEIEAARSFGIPVVYPLGWDKPWNKTPRSAP